MNLRRWLERVVLGWTAFTTVFLWTVANRGFWRPSISSASLGPEAGGRTLTFWVLLGLAPLALGMFYLHGRRRLKPLFRGLLLSWHFTLAGVAAGLALLTHGKAEFVGATWGWTVPIGLLASLLAVMALAAAWFVVLDVRAPAQAHRPWTGIRWKELIAAVALTPVVAAVFHLGDGYDWSARVATAGAIVQWLLFIHAVENDA